MVAEATAWNHTMATLFVWLRETGMRLGEALHLQRTDINPCGRFVTLRHGVKGNRRSGRKTRVIALGRAAALLPGLQSEGRLFENLPLNVAKVSTAYGQWAMMVSMLGVPAREAVGRAGREIVSPEAEPAYSTPTSKAPGCV